MSTYDTYFKRNNSSSKEVAVSAFNNMPLIRRENFCKSSTIHVNPLCTSNKILVNKEKLSKSVSRTITVDPTVSKAEIPLKGERIYCNPKFLTKQVKCASNVIMNTNNCQSEQNKKAGGDTNIIHINRDYLNTIQNKRNISAAAPPINYSCSNNYVQYSSEQNRGIHINPKFLVKNQNVQLENVEINSEQSGVIAAISEISPLQQLQPQHQHQKLHSHQQCCTPSSVSATLHNPVIKPKQSPLVRNSSIIKSTIHSKYKLVKPSSQQTKTKSFNITSPSVCYKTKYSLKRLTTAVGRKLINNNKVPAEIPKVKTPINISKHKLIRLSSEFKKLSRTKLVRKSVLQSMILARRRSRNNLLKIFQRSTLYKKVPCSSSSVKKKTKNITYFPKGNNNNSRQTNTNFTTRTTCSTNSHHSFKRLSKMKIVRKSLLKAHIESRKQVRKLYLRNQIILKSRTKNFLRKKHVVKQRALLKWRKRKLGDSIQQPKCKRVNSQTPSKNLKKNNQPCPFYNRFGRCKGKDRGTCPKLHDVKYISICRKLLQGECNAKDCLLSHDIRPGKMPTCHHYLAGLCTRPNCPFLHIKVNPKAPICMAFLQGFCPDVFNCLKRHEFICPIFAEKGSCPRGKCCTYPHRSPVVHCKLLQDDQKPLIARQDITGEQDICNDRKYVKKVSGTPPTNSDNPSSSSSSCSSSTLESQNGDKKGINYKVLLKTIKKRKKEFVKEPFTRYFAVAAASISDASNSTSNTEDSQEISENNEEKIKAQLTTNIDNNNIVEEFR